MSPGTLPYVFDWTFEDGSPNVSIQGDPTARTAL